MYNIISRFLCHDCISIVGVGVRIQDCLGTWRLASLCASTLREDLRFHGTGCRPVAVLGMWGLIIHTCSGIERLS